MKAVIWTKYGPPEVLQIVELEKPIPQENEVLIRVRAATVFPGDAEIRRFDVPFWAMWLPMRLFLGILKPTRIKVLGQEVAGDIEAVGKDVKRLKPGDKVIGMTGFGFGGYAEYICLSEEMTMKRGLVAAKPNNMSYEEAAAIPVGGLNAWHFIRRAKIVDGVKMLINGAGGSIGTFAVQLAKACGAEVTAVDNGPKLEMLRSIGADHVVCLTVSGEIILLVVDYMICRPAPSLPM